MIGIVIDLQNATFLRSHFPLTIFIRIQSPDDPFGELGGPLESGVHLGETAGIKNGQHMSVQFRSPACQILCTSLDVISIDDHAA